jgi:glycosyltransferase involved in cell wall biosynthesis
MKTIVVSAVNVNRGGTLTILRECLAYLSGLSEIENYRVVALVHRKELAFFRNIEYIEMRWPKKTWINRLWCEYVTMKKISLNLSPVHLWLSMHDTTPTVVSERRAVYCHNSFPFYKWKMSDILFGPKVVLFALLSKCVYRKNIRKNNYVIVQQQCFRKKFIQLFGLKELSVIVFPPSPNQNDIDVEAPHIFSSTKYSFFYPAISDSHKNFECLCRASSLLEKEIGTGQFEVYVTVAGDENAYTRWLYRKWGRDIFSLNFTGYLDKKTMYEYYNRCHCLVFPSKVETWGLPITEFAAFNKPMLLADLPYAHETANGCSQVAFFDPDNPRELASKMKSLIQGDTRFLKAVEKNIISPPAAQSWRELFDILLA